MDDLDQLSLKIRILEEDDLMALEWGGEYSHFRRLYRDIYKNCLDGKGLMWGVELNGSGLIGQVFVQFKSCRAELANGFDRAYMYSFRIQSPYRNRGIGKYLLQVVEKDLTVRNFSWATLNVAKDNPSALRFYLRNGYRLVASEPGNWTYLDDQGVLHNVHEPAWRMQKHLSKTKKLKTSS